MVTATSKAVEGCVPKGGKPLGLYRGSSEWAMNELNQDRFREVPGHIPVSPRYLTQSALHCSRGPMQS